MVRIGLCLIVSSGKILEVFTGCLEGDGLFTECKRSLSTETGSKGTLF